MTGETGAHWNVIRNSTFGIDTAGSGTRIDTFATDAALFPRTVIVQNAFRSARAVRITDVIRRTDAGYGLALLTTFGVCATRMSIAWSRLSLHNAWFDYKSFND